MLDISTTAQIALSAFSQTARYFLDGLNARAVIPSEPSIPGSNFWVRSSVL